MEIVITSKGTVGNNNVNVALADGNYAVVGITKVVSQIKERGTGVVKEYTSYNPVVALIEGNSAVSLSVMTKTDLTRLGDHNRILLNIDTRQRADNSGTVVDAVHSIYAANVGENFDILWIQKVLPALRGKVFSLAATFFSSRSRQNNVYTAHTYAANYTGTSFDVAANKANIEALASQCSIDLIGLDPSETFEFKAQ